MGTPAVESRRRKCRWPGCGADFRVCRSCDRGYLYCSEECNRLAFLTNHSRSNNVYQQSFAARLDHAERQRAYRERQREKKVTDQGRDFSGPSASIDSHAKKTIFVSERVEARTLHVSRRPAYPRRKAIYELLRCLICRRLVASRAEVLGSN